MACRDVWFLACPGVELLDLTGPWEVLAHANDVLGQPAYRLHLVSAATRTVASRHGLTVSGAHALPAVDLPTAHTLVVAGGSPELLLPAPEQKLVRWLRRHHTPAARVVSICLGAFLLGEAGLLDGHRATTHWRYLDHLRARFPKTHVVGEEIYTRDRRVWTSAGITAGIDLTLALVEADHGPDIAMAVARNLLLFLRRSGHQAQFSPTLQRQQAAPAQLRDLAGFVLDHLDQPISVQHLADHLGLSARTLTRRCRDELGQSPAALVRSIRLDEARRLLEETALPLAEIAARTGLGDVSTLWRTFTQHLGIAPAEYRHRFTAHGSPEPRP